MEAGKLYWHGECQGCESYGVECETGCEYSENPDPCPCFTPKVYDCEEPDYSD